MPDTHGNERNFPQVKFDSEVNACFLLNGHGNLYFFECIIIVNILSYLILKKLKNLSERKRDIGEKTANYDRENNDSTKALHPRRFK